jgi:prepilin-type N-terminal cleavage/methylation domain-containing protein
MSGRGFTLLELLVALAITSLFTLWIAQLTTSTLKAKEKSDAYAEAALFCREVLNSQTQDQAISASQSVDYRKTAVSRGWALIIERNSIPDYPGIEQITVSLDVKNGISPLKIRKWIRSRHG